MDDEKKYFFDKPENIKKVLRIFYSLCAGLLAIDLFYHRHILHSWENLWGFYAIFGFIGCVILVLVAREMRKLLMRDEDYYDD